MTINYFFHYYKIILITFFTVDNNQMIMVKYCVNRHYNNTI